MQINKKFSSIVLSVVFGVSSWPAFAQSLGDLENLGNFFGGPDCAGLPSHADLQAALAANVFDDSDGTNGGLDNDMWATIVNADGDVCGVAFTGADRNDQWGLSRAISAQKANTARGLSREQGTGGAEIALSTANLWAAVQPGGSLFGLQHSNPVSTSVAYFGPSQLYGTPLDPMVGQKIGGVNVFGGGLALYKDGVLVGGLGASGDTSCADHNVAWRVRSALGFAIPPGVSNNGDDGIIYDVGNAFGHPDCIGTEKDVAVAIGSGS